jgi:Tfp pilus assembly PilM family ATPase
MALSWNKARYSPIAVDFGGHSLKLLQVVPDDPPQLIAAGAAEVPADAPDRWALFRQATRELVEKLPFKGREAVCTTPSHQTLIQHLQISPVDPPDLSEAVNQELRLRMNMDPSRMVVRHFPVGQFVRQGSARLEVICIAAARDTVMRQIAILKHAGLETAGILSEPQAVVQSFAHLYRRHDGDQQTTCFVDLGASTVKVMIAHGTDLVFAKTIHQIDLAGADDPALTHAASDATDAAFNRGGAALERSGARAATAIAPTRASLGVSTSARQSHAEQQDSAFECLIDELQMSLRYHLGMYPERAVEQLIFLGGGARAMDQCQRIAQALRIAAQLGDPLARLVRPSGGATPIGLDMREAQPGWAVPMGLCLSQT